MVFTRQENAHNLRQAHSYTVYLLFDTMLEENKYTIRTILLMTNPWMKYVMMVDHKKAL